MLRVQSKVWIFYIKFSFQKKISDESRRKAIKQKRYFTASNIHTKRKAYLMHNFLSNFCMLLQRTEKENGYMRKTKKIKFQSDYSIYVLQHNFFLHPCAIILLTCMKNYVYFSWHEFFSPSYLMRCYLLGFHFIFALAPTVVLPGMIRERNESTRHGIFSS